MPLAGQGMTLRNAACNSLRKDDSTPNNESMVGAMKTSRRTRILKTHVALGFWVAGALTFATPSWAVAAQDGVAAQTAVATAEETRAIERNAPSSTPTRYSSGVAEIAKMVEAGVGNDVIKAYIQNSTTAYRPDATEIIALKEKGASADVLTAMLTRGGELRSQQARETASPPAAFAPQSADSQYAPASAYEFAQPVVYPDYSYSYPIYDSSYWWYSYPWPSIYWPSFYFSYYSPYCYPRSHYAYGRCPPYRYAANYWGKGHPYRGAAPRPTPYGRQNGAVVGRAGGFRPSGYSGPSRSFSGYNTAFRPSGYGGPSVSFAGRSSGFRPSGFSGQSVSRPSYGGGFRPSGGFSGRPATFGGFSSSARPSGGTGGRSFGRR